MENGETETNNQKDLNTNSEIKKKTTKKIKIVSNYIIK